MKLVPSEVPLLLVCNGVGRAERRRLAECCPGRPTVSLSVLPGTFCRHGTVLDLLVTAVESDFIVLDHDCYVFDRSLFEPVAWREGEVLAAIDRQGFYTVDERSGLRFPRTHFLVLRRRSLVDLRVRHGIGCEKRTKTPRRVADLLAGIGIGDHNFPPARMPFYDTLQLAISVAFAEGGAVRWLSPAPDGISHVGGTARLRNEPAPEKASAAAGRDGSAV